MKILIDTSIWSLALRRSSTDLNDKQHHLVKVWTALVREGRASLIGPIRQEILSGVRQQEVFQTLRNRLAAFDDLPLQTGDYEEAARLFNYCRSRGIVGTPVDLLICAVADRLSLAIFTTDHDFDVYAKHLSIRLHTTKG